jgi:tripartite-type tricarboxylate transporter receptor subunit TctC
MSLQPRGRWTVVILLMFLAFGSLGVCKTAQAQEKYPNRPIEFIIAFVAGGPTDLWGRLLAEEMRKILGVSLTPINRAGATGTLGAIAVLKAPKDGYTLLTNTAAGMVLAPVVLKDVSYDAAKDFEPIVLIASMPDVVIVKADSPYKTMNDLIEAARQNAGKLSYGTVGTGSVGHFNGEILSRSNNIKMKHVPFKGTGESAPAILGGHVDICFGAATSFMPLIQAGKLRALMLTGKSRLKVLPDVATFVELGVKGSYIENWVGCFVAGRTPKSVVDLLAGAAEKAIMAKGFSEQIEKGGGVVHPISPGEFKSMIEADKKVATEIAKEIGIGIYKKSQ